MKARFYFSSNDLHNFCIGSMIVGCPFDIEIANITDYRPADVAVMFGTYKKQVSISWSRGEILRKQRMAGLKTIVLDSGYIRRGETMDDYYAVGFDGLNGRADFRNENMPADRLDELGVCMEPWKDGGDHILLCGQVPWDASVQNVDVLRWLRDAVDYIREVSDRPIRYRPHPKAINASPPIDGTDYSLKPLKSDLANAWAVVTYNSNTAVEAAMLGKPVFAFDKGSMAWPIANREWEQLKNPDRPNRMQWAADLAYCQWRCEEMRQGLPWGHLFRE